jgi:hypothetical protein
MPMKYRYTTQAQMPHACGRGTAIARKAAMVSRLAQVCKINVY